MSLTSEITENVVSPQPKRKGHAHRRSAAISGDFDSMGIHFLSSSSTPSLSPTKPNFKFGGLDEVALVPNKEFSFPLVSDNKQQQDTKSCQESRLQEPKTKPKKSDMSLSTKYSTDSLANEVSSTETTPENNPSDPKINPIPTNLISSITNDSNEIIDAEELNSRLSQSSKFYLSTGPVLDETVPSAVIDLDAALNFSFDDKPKTKARSHRRTESAPELDFFSSPTFGIERNPNKLTINTGLGLQSASAGTSNPQNRRSFYAPLSPTTDVPIVEEEEEDDPRELNSLSKKPSMYSNEYSAGSSASLTKESTSVNSESSIGNSTDELRKYSSTSPKFANILQPPAPIGTRRGRTAARYQNHYDASKLLIDALRSTESLTLNKTESKDSKDVGHKMSMPILSNGNHTTLKNSSSTGKLVKPSKSLSPTRFNFEPIVYDVPEKPLELLRSYQKEQEKEQQEKEREERERDDISEVSAETSMSSICASMDELNRPVDNPVQRKQVKAHLSNPVWPNHSSLHHRKSHSISVSVTDDLSGKFSLNKTKLIKMFGSNAQKPEPAKQTSESLSLPKAGNFHKRKSSILSSIQQLLSASSASSSRADVMQKPSDQTSSSNEVDFDCLVSTPVLERIGTSSRDVEVSRLTSPTVQRKDISLKDNYGEMETPKQNQGAKFGSFTNFLDISQMSNQTITNDSSSQLDLTIVHPSVRKKDSTYSLLSDSGPLVLESVRPPSGFNTLDSASLTPSSRPRSIIDDISNELKSQAPKMESKSLFRINTKSSLSLSLNNILKTPKRKVSSQFDSLSAVNAEQTDTSGYTVSSSKRSSKYSKILSWIKPKNGQVQAR